MTVHDVQVKRGAYQIERLKFGASLDRPFRDTRLSLFDPRRKTISEPIMVLFMTGHGINLCGIAMEHHRPKLAQH